jgi:Uma2 family endonuclease
MAVKATRRLHRFTLDDYENMAKLGLITRADKVVLLDGLLVKKMTEGPRHATTKHRVYNALESVLPSGWHARMESPVRLPAPPTRPSEPEPDVAVVRGEVNAYENRHTEPADTLLVIEVAQRSLAADRKDLARYAYHAIPCVWVINLRNDSVEVYTEPSGPSDDPGYVNREVKGWGDVLSFLVDGQTCGPIAVDSLFR